MMSRDSVYIGTREGKPVHVEESREVKEKGEECGGGWGRGRKKRKNYLFCQNFIKEFFFFQERREREREKKKEKKKKREEGLMSSWIVFFQILSSKKGSNCCFRWKR